MNDQNRGTVSGIIAVLLWSTAAVFMAAAESVNPFLFEGILAACCAIIFLLNWVYNKYIPYKEILKTPSWYIISGIFGISLHGVAWVAAIQNAPPIEALLFVYQWPVLVVIFTAISTGKKLYSRHYISLLLGILGITILLAGKGLSFTDFKLSTGHIYALIAALTWSIFSAISARHKSVTINALFTVMIFGSFINMGIWALYFDLVQPTNNDLFICIIGAFVVMPGYILWDYGMKNGNHQTIGTVSFLTPVLSSIILVVLGYASFTKYSLIALGIIMCGIGVTQYGDNIANKKIILQKEQG